jgi:MSHA biogenesis protein MshM
MYLEHFGLKELPFRLTPDTGYFLGLPDHQRALQTLLVALRSGEGFLKVTGEVGCGKTLLCRKLLATLGTGFVSAYIPNPFLTPEALRMALAEELGLRFARSIGQHELLSLISSRLVALHAQGTPVVLCLDEAQALPLESLEALRLLTNLETEKRKLLQVVLFAQPELDKRLADPGLRQLRQRISFASTLAPLDRAATAAYLDWRLRQAGQRGAPLFAPAAVGVVHRASGGVPRVINILAHKCLLLAYGKGLHQVSRALVHAAARDTEGARQGLALRLTAWFAA